MIFRRGLKDKLFSRIITERYILFDFLFKRERERERTLVHMYMCVFKITNKQTGDIFYHLRFSKIKNYLLKISRKYVVYQLEFKLVLHSFEYRS